MALPLEPILEVGATRPLRENLQAYGDFDFYGVQAPAVATTDDMRGPNEDFRFLRDCYSFLTEEHDANGNHDTLQIARIFLRATYDGTNYVVDPRSYVMGKTFLADAAAFTITAGAAGEITVDVDAAYALPNGTYMGCVDRYDSDPSWDALEMGRTQLRSVTDSTTFLLRRWDCHFVVGAGLSATLAHGPINVLLFAEA